MQRSAVRSWGLGCQPLERPVLPGLMGRHPKRLLLCAHHSCMCLPALRLPIPRSLRSATDPVVPRVAQLADFGFSKDANQDSAPTSRVGTPAYLAPEVITNQVGQVYDGQVGEAHGCAAV